MNDKTPQPLRYLNEDDSLQKIEPETRAWHLFHRLWTKAVGTDGYVKREWQQLELLVFSVDKRVTGNDPT